MRRLATLLSALLTFSLFVACASSAVPETTATQAAIAEASAAPTAVQPPITKPLSTPTETPSRGRDERPKNIILIGWDGAQRNHVKEALGRGERTDIAPTILKRFGLDLGKIEPPPDGHPLTDNAPLW